MIVPERYTRIAILLHWLIAALILANLILVWTIDSMPDSWQRPFVDTHKSIGITVLGLAIMRLLWRWTHRPPALPRSYPTLEQRLSHVAHIVLYVLIFAMPISGWMHDSAWNGGASHPFWLFGVIPWFRIPALANLPPATKDVLHAQLFWVHQALAYVLYVLVGLHIVGAFKHQFIDREPELQRMLPGSVGPVTRSRTVADR